MPRPPAPQVTPVRSGGPSMALIGGVVVLIVALIAALVWAAARGSDLDAAGSSNALENGGGISVGPGRDADVPQIQVYEDFQCPWCGVLEGSIGEGLTERIAAGEINVTYQIMSFLDGSLRNDSSTRATNAALCADDAGAFLPFHAAVYAGQPQEEGVGFTDEQLLGWGEDSGITGDALETFASCTENLEHADYVEAMQQRANEDGVTGTPTVVINGETISNEEMQALMGDPSALDGVIEAHS
ncbi:MULTISPECIES: DsbA family protein [unclassified Ornithinimicrobium]|uniref:DsbA family protein n=1 Tax=unclassified Ornithinimicrobium TaxID=2615080 RepID=UPI003852D74D